MTGARMSHQVVMLPNYQLGIMRTLRVNDWKLGIRGHMTDISSFALITSFF